MRDSLLASAARVRTAAASAEPGVPVQVFYKQLSYPSTRQLSTFIRNDDKKRIEKRKFVERLLT